MRGIRSKMMIIWTLGQKYFPIFIKTIVVNFFYLSFSYSYGGLLRVESETLLGVRRDTDLKIESPMTEYFHANYLSEQFQFDTNFSLMMNPFKHQKDDGRLYTLHLNYLMSDQIKIQAGRIFPVNKTLNGKSVDHLGFDFILYDDQLTISPYLDFEKEFDSTRATQVYGVATTFQPQLIDSMKWNLFWERQQMIDSSTKDDIAGVSASKSFLIPLNPELLMRYEGSINPSTIRRGEAGVDFYPTNRSTFGFQVLVHDTSSERDSYLFPIFSEGKLYEMVFKVGYHFNKFLFPSLSIGYNEYEIQGASHLSFGKKIQLASQGSFEFSDYVAHLFYISSYGGWAAGSEFYLNYPINSYWALDGAFENVYYEKITRSKRWALSSRVGLSRFIWERFKLNFGFEAGSNNQLTYDYRIFGQLIYLFWSET